MHEPGLLDFTAPDDSNRLRGSGVDYRDQGYVTSVSACVNSKMIAKMNVVHSFAKQLSCIRSLIHCWVTNSVSAAMLGQYIS